MKYPFLPFLLLIAQVICVTAFAQSRTVELVNQLKENKPGTYYNYQEALSNPLAVVHLNIRYNIVGSEIGCFSNLESINFNYSFEDYSEIPPELFQLKKLKKISILSSNTPSLFPKAIANLTLLEDLRIGGAILPDEASTLTKLKKIEVFSVSPGLEFTSFPNLESIELSILDSLNLEKINRVTIPAFVSDRKPLKELRIEKAKFTSANFRNIIQILSKLPAIESLAMNYELTDSIDIEIKLPPGSFRHLKQLEVAATTTNQFLFRECQTIKSLAITGISFSLFDIDRALLKPFDITLGIKKLSSLSISFGGIILKNYDSFFNSIEVQDSLIEIELSDIYLKDASDLSFDCLRNLKKINSIVLDRCENISLSFIFNNISSNNKQIKVSILNCSWRDYEITIGNNQINEFNFWNNEGLATFSWKLFPNVSQIFADSYSYDLNEIGTVRTIIFVDTYQFPDLLERTQLLKGNISTNFQFIDYPMNSSRYRSLYFPPMNCWEPLVTKSTIYYYGKNYPQDSTFNGDSMRVFWYPSGKKKSVVSEVGDYIHTQYFYEKGIRSFEKFELKSSKRNENKGLLIETKWNEAGAMVYYKYMHIDKKYYYRILFYSDGHIRRIDSIENGKKIPVQKYPPFASKKRRP